MGSKVGLFGDEPKVRRSESPRSLTSGTPPTATVSNVDSPSKISPNGSTDSSMCRICHDGDGTEMLLAPCSCTGTVALIHGSCLERWLTSSNTDKCEICKHQFQTTREPRSCAEYMQDTDNRFNVRNIIADVVCFILLTPLLVVSTYLCAVGANQYFARERWEAIGLIVLALFLLVVYFTWCHLTMKFHFGIWTSWQASNQRIRLTQVTSHRRGRSETWRPAALSPLGLLRPGPGTQTCHNHNHIAVNMLEDELNESDTSRIIV